MHIDVCTAACPSMGYSSQHSQSLLQAQTRVIQLPLTIVLKIVQYIEYLAKVFSTVAGNVACSC